MGIYSDTLEYNREHNSIDPCMYINVSNYSHDCYIPLWEHYCREDSIALAQQRDSAFSAQVNELMRLSVAEKKYLSFHYLLDICIYREKQLLELKNHQQFSTHLVIDAIDEYISIVRESLQHAITEITSAKQALHQLPAYSFEVDDSVEREVPIRTLVDNLFRYLSSVADFDDSQLLQSLFVDMSKLIGLIVPDISRKKPKIVCREYYERTFHPKSGIARCENCGEPLYAGCPYCFNCFERS